MKPESFVERDDVERDDVERDDVEHGVQTMTARLFRGESVAEVDSAARVLLEGGLVAIPTETVYGLGADASNPSAVARVFAVKGRPTGHPLIVHVADLDHARLLSSAWSASAEVLGRTFWPGPLSVLTAKSTIVSSVVTGARPTVVVRVPRHPATLRLLVRLHDAGSCGLAAPSANRFGSISPTTAQHVLSDIGEEIDAVLDGGPCSVGLESTIVDCTTAKARILRPGAVTHEAVSSSLAEHGIATEERQVSTNSSDDSSAIAPGMLRSHYAPSTRLEVFESDGHLAEARNRHAAAGRTVAIVPRPADDFEYSRSLYSMLRDCDDRRADVILAVLPLDEGVGTAIRDRLLRASADR